MASDYRITSATFLPPSSDPTIPDAFMDEQALTDLKKSVGITGELISTTASGIEVNVPTFGRTWRNSK